MLLDIFSCAFDQYSVKDTICILAVSGGADSMALLRLILDDQVKHSRFKKIIVATMDHGLRPESAEEARFVKQCCEQFKIEHITLTWIGEKPTTGIQKKARQVRYAQLFDVCRFYGAQYLMTAHHFEDQVETFFLRLFRGSGVKGLCSMPILRQTDFGYLFRPLLNVRKADLLTYLEMKGQPFVSDPSNENLQFERVKIRRLVAHMTKEGFALEGVGRTMGHCQNQQAFIERRVTEALQQTWHPPNFYVESFRMLDPFIQQESLRYILWSLSHKDYPPKFARLEAVLEHLTQRENFTHAGYLWRYYKNMYTVTPEKVDRGGKII